MDVQDYLRRVKPIIEADKIRKNIKEKIKAAQYAEQDKREGLKETFKPITDELKKVDEGIDELKDELKDLKAIEGPPALPAIEGPASLEEPKEDNIIINADKNFTPEELSIFRNIDIPIPSKVLKDSFKNKDAIDKAIEKSLEYNTSTIKKERNNIKKNKYLTGKQKNDANEELNIVRETNKKYVKELRFLKESKNIMQTGSGIFYYNNPNDLLDRLELLGGSISAGNNSVKEEFSKVAHTLWKLNLINSKKLNQLLKTFL